MTPEQFKSIRQSKRLTQSGLADLLRIKDRRTIRRWEKGDVPVSGPAGLLMTLLDEGIWKP